MNLNLIKITRETSFLSLNPHSLSTCIFKGAVTTHLSPPYSCYNNLVPLPTACLLSFLVAMFPPLLSDLGGVFSGDGLGSPQLSVTSTNLRTTLLLICSSTVLLECVGERVQGFDPDLSMPPYHIQICYPLQICDLMLVVGPAVVFLLFGQRFRASP